MNKINFYRASLPALILVSMLVNCSAIESIIQKKEYVPIANMDYIVNGRYEANSAYVSFSNSGVTLSILQLEETFSVWVEDIPTDPNNNNWLNVIDNGKKIDSIHLETGKHLYLITTTSYSGNLIEFVKATEANVGEVRIYGLELTKKIFKGDSIETWIKNIPRIQFIGNSITCGYGNMVSIPAPPQGNPLTGFHSSNQNAYESYAMQTARKLQMAPMLVSFSGKGMYRNFDSDTVETMPKIYERVYLQKANSAVWDHTKQIPDIVVINLGTNDYFGESRNKPLNDSVFIQTYIQFVERLISYYPKAKIICVNGPMLNDGYPEGKKSWTRVQVSIQKVQEYFKAKGNTTIYTYFFEPQSAPFGEDYHPSLATHTKMAEELSTFIQTVVNK